MREMKATAASSVMKVDQRCKHCGKNHDSNVCWYKDQKCFNCGKVGHVASICRAEKNFQAPSQGRNSRRQLRNSANFSKIRTLELKGDHSLGRRSVPIGWHQIILMRLIPSKMERYRYLLLAIHPAFWWRSRLMKTYSGEILEIVGELPVQVVYRNQGTISLGERKSAMILGRN